MTLAHRQTEKSNGFSARKNINLDSVDRKLIALLVANARESVTDLAKKLGLGRTTVHERLARLERNRVIAGYSTILSRSLEGNSNRALVMLSIVQRMQPALMEHLKMLPEVLSCYTVSGEFDLILLVEAPQMDDVDAVLDEIICLPGVERCRTSIIMATNFQRGNGQAIAVG
ncbi:Lrp/AsnC family transcriptional regulator [Mesorhizobium sp. B2-7-1]|uniref:Lrp/AsnC family transcriptional regulator n=1 Tax=Mesorhizobium sp. B2-7-1 TaxID=2589909 RepID=UPI0011268E7F|nr:Lrp/AsnC family transcriptional regulator [Mesorhizobium sp. B2-7-1]TPJ74584.1 Lrp/AsnC family transcriptional regulator [Mesorhizobium sp. B2-7-1]